MINKLLDEVYWEELSETLTPAIERIEASGLKESDWWNGMSDLSFSVVRSFCLYGLEAFEGEDVMSCSKSELNQVIPFIQNNLSLLKTYLLNWIDTQVRVNHTRRQEPFRFITILQAEEETKIERLNLLAKLQMESNVEVLLQTYQNLYREESVILEKNAKVLKGKYD